MKIAIIGNTLDAYIAAVSIASFGNDVLLVTGGSEATAEVQHSIENEPDLKRMMNEALSLSRLRIQEKLTPNAMTLQCYWFFYEGDSFDCLQKKIDAVMYSTPTTYVVLTTTLGVGTYMRVQEKFHNLGLELATVPSFIREGDAISGFLNPELLIIGAKSQRMISILSKLLSGVIEKSQKVMFVSGTEAEFIKTSICSILATKISLINELSGLSESLDFDIKTVIEGVTADSRVGSYYLNPGCGFGGMTLSQEVSNLLKLLSTRSSSGSEMMQAVVDTNFNQKELLFRKFWKFYKGNVKGLKVAIWGVSFKPNSSSIKNSPIHEVLNALNAQGCDVVIYDPSGFDAIKKSYPNIDCCNDKFTAIRQADALFILTEWDEFKTVNWLTAKNMMVSPVIFDGRNMFEPGEMFELGFKYFGIGRGMNLKEVI